MYITNFANYTEKKFSLTMDLPDWLLIIPPVMSFLAVMWIYFKVLKLAKVKDLVDTHKTELVRKGQWGIML